MSGHDIEPGAVFVESWGYDQTNVNAYEVVRVTAASVAIKPVKQEIVSGRVRPVRGEIREWRDHCRVGKVNARGEVLKRVSSGWRGEPWLNMTSYSGASLWDGVESFYDTYAAGQPGH